MVTRIRPKRQSNSTRTAEDTKQDKKSKENCSHVKPTHQAAVRLGESKIITYQWKEES